MTADETDSRILTILAMRSLRDANDPVGDVPFPRTSGLYLRFVVPAAPVIVALQAASGGALRATVCAVALLSAIGFVLAGAAVSRRRVARRRLSSLWNDYARLLLAVSDDSPFTVDTLRILAETDAHLPPGAAEVAEISRQTCLNTRARISALDAYLRLRIASHDRATLSAALRATRNGR